MPETRAPYNASSTFKPGEVDPDAMRDMWIMLRQARLNEVAAIEKMAIERGWMDGPTTAECRKIAKIAKRKQ